MKAQLPDTEIMYDAVLKKDESFEGIFYTAVKTTGIFCRPGCTARTPKKENVEFYASTREAILNGYRPCKICSPLTPKGHAPEWLKPLLEEINNSSNLRIKDWNLRELGLDPARVRRWFKKNHGMTFQTYLRVLRVSSAFKQIKHGDKVIEAAFDSGYESLSGFTDSFKKTMGYSPVNSKINQVVVIKKLLTPLGPMLAGATEKGICLLEFMDRRMLETQIKIIKKTLKTELIPGSSKHFDELQLQLDSYFAGKLNKFTIPLDMVGTDFQKKVWRVLQTIPHGSTRSYKQQAELIGNPQAVRAVAKANGDNRISILIPCHRVIGSDGKLVGYGGGLWRKKYLLDLEKENC